LQNDYKLNYQTITLQ